MTETPSDRLEVGGDDVISMEAAASLMGTQTFKLSQFIKYLMTVMQSSAMQRWLEEGADCELLQASGGGWRRGKVRIRFEFIPEQPKLPGSDPKPSSRDDEQ